MSLFKVGGFSSSNNPRRNNQNSNVMNVKTSLPLQQHFSWLCFVNDTSYFLFIILLSDVFDISEWFSVRVENNTTSNWELFPKCMHRTVQQHYTGTTVSDTKVCIHKISSCLALALTLSVTQATSSTMSSTWIE